MFPGVSSCTYLGGAAHPLSISASIGKLTAQAGKSVQRFNHLCILLPPHIGTGMYGHLCGNLATGLMLIRVMDPTQETNASQSVSTSATLGYAWQIPYMIIGSLTIFTAPTATTVVSVALLLFFLIGGSILFGRKRKTA